MSQTSSGVCRRGRKNHKFKSRLVAILAAVLLLGATACSQTVAKPVTTHAPTATPGPAPTLQPGDSTRQLTVSGLERSYILHIPPGLDSLRPVPVVFVFHGLLDDAVSIQTTTGFNAIADKNGFPVLYPNGSGPSEALSWNAGGCCGYAAENNTDEITFIRHMLTDLGTIVRVDPKRIYATGYDNGAMLSYRLACEMSDTFAAVAPVSGWLLTNPCRPQQPVSVVVVHGLDDKYNGGIGASLYATHSDFVFPSVEQGIATWVQLDGCGGSAQVEQQGAVTYTTYASCQAGTEVELYAIEKWGHAWPPPYALPAISSPMIWDFFAAHAKQ